MDISQFDPSQFLDATTTEAASRRPPLPVENPATSDHLYTGILSEPVMRTWQGKKDPGQSGIACDFKVTIEVPPQLQDQLKLQPQVILNGGFIVDLTENGQIDWSPGRNSRTRIYREATGLNTAGKPFSFRQFAGKIVKVKIEHELYQGEIVDKIGTVLKG